MNAPRKLRHFRIHPAIGFARLGNAPRSPTGEGWFLGPEQPFAPINASGKVPGPFNDSNHRVMAQGVRFRLFEYLDGAAREVRPGSAESDITKITWRVHMANRKAAFFQFWGPLGRRTLFGGPLQKVSWLVRNKRIPREQRESKLVLDAGPHSIDSNQPDEFVDVLNVNPETKDFIEFLGQLLVEKSGRLIVLGGRGKSVFARSICPAVDEARSLKTYANNDGWFDDVADGPVSATLHFKDGSTQNLAPHEGAWVVSAPPDFAPAVRPVRSMWDTLLDVYVRTGTPPLREDVTHGSGTGAELARAWDLSCGRFHEGYRPSFTRTIYPILAAAAELVGSHAIPSRRMAHRGLSHENMGTLGGPGSDPVLRRRVFERIRPPGTWRYDTSLMPVAHGDLYFDATPGSGFLRRLAHRILQVPGRLLTVSKLQYALLEKWQAGCFDEDWNPATQATPAPEVITPEGLDEAALREASGGAFVPGIECSWMLTSPKLYAAPFRLEAEKSIRQNTYIGPLQLSAGSIVAQMALPWQADFADCKQEAVIGEMVQVAWWPSQRPDDVLVDGTDGQQDLGWQPWAAAQDAIQDDGTRFHGMVDHWHEFEFIVKRADGSIGPEK